MTGRRALTALAVALAVGAGLLAMAAPAHACSCAPGPLQARAERSDAVFVARVHEPVGEPERSGMSVTQVLDGRVPALVRLDAQDPSLCGYRLTEGRRHLVFAERRPDGSFTTQLCSGNRTLPDGPLPDRLVDVLGPPREPIPAGADRGARDLHPPAQSVVPTWSLWAGGLGLVGLGAAGVLLLRRRHR